MAIKSDNRVIHRFIREISAYEFGGDLYSQIIPLDTQAYAIYPNKDGNRFFYVIGDGEHTYTEIRDGKGLGEAYKEYPVFTKSNLNVIVSGVEEEARERKAADEVLQALIEEEKRLREQADIILQQQIDDNEESMSILSSRLTDEILERRSDVERLDTAISEEQTARSEGDEDLTSKLNKEIAERKQFDDLLDEAIGEEISIRSGADESLAQDIAAEELRATQAETSLQNTKQDILTAGTGISIENNVISNTQPQVIIEDNLTSYSTTSALSANMGRVLQDEVENVKARGRYLSLWDCATGLAETNPPENPYTYKSGDYFIVGNVAESGNANYKPSGSTYVIGQASSTVETSEIHEDDTYIFDGSIWHIQETSQKTVTFASIVGEPSDNIALNTELNSKQDVLVNQENIKSINGASLLGSGNLEIAAHLEYPSTWPTSSSTTTKQFCDAVAEDNTAIEGKTYLGEVRWSDLPGLVNGEVEVEIMTGTTASSKVIVLTLTSGNKSPYMWKYTYWNHGHNVSGWKGFVPTTEVANKIYGTDSNGNQTTYDKDSFGKIDDVRVDGVSVVSNKIANLGTMASEDSSNYTTTSDLNSLLEAKANVSDLGTMAAESASDYSTKAVADTLYADKSLEQTVETHVSNTDIHVTAADKLNWDAKQAALTAGNNIDITNGVISATDTTYTAGTGIDITNGVISNTQTSAEWGNITGTLSDQTDLQTALNDKQDVISDLSDIRSGASAGATALQPNDNISELQNDVGYITGITSSDVTTALGYTPYDSSNPQGYTSNVGTVISVNNTSPDNNGNVTLSIPAAQVNSDWNANSGVAEILNKPTLGTMSAENASDYTPTANLATVAITGNYSDLSGTPNIPIVNDATLTISQNGVVKGTFSANASSNTTINLDTVTTVATIYDYSTNNEES